MSVRKRNWTTSKGVVNEMWLADYKDGNGKRRYKQFDRKKDAEAFINNTKVDLSKGVHTAESRTVTVAKAGAAWITSCENRGLEASTVEAYKIHLKLHINKYIGSHKLTKLGVPVIREFEDTLRANGRSPAMIRKILTSLSSLLADALSRGTVSRNVVRELGGGRRHGGKAAERHEVALRIGVDIPTRQEINAIIDASNGTMWRPLLLTAIFTGLRASELRGLQWSDVDLANPPKLHVTQRADKFNQMGSPKSKTSARTLPLVPMAANALREQKLSTGGTGLVFPSPRGLVLALSTIITMGWHPMQIAAGVVKPDGTAKHGGLHTLRHFYASWCISSPESGGRGLSAKEVQVLLGHSTIGMTMDVYSHLFPQVDQQAEMEAAEKAFRR